MTAHELSLVWFFPDETKFNQKSCDLLNKKLAEVLGKAVPKSYGWYYMAKKFHDYVDDRKWRFVDERRVAGIRVDL